MTTAPTSNRPVVDIEEMITGTPEEIFDAWTDPECLKQWFVGGKTNCVSLAETDPRPGGKYRIVMSGDERDYDHYGEYIEVDRPGRLVFTWHTPSIDYVESLVTVTLTPGDEGRTRLRLVHEKLPDHMVEPHRAGWAELLQKLDTIKS